MKDLTPGFKKGVGGGGRVLNSYEMMTGMEKQRLQEKFAFVHLYPTPNEI